MAHKKKNFTIAANWKMNPTSLAEARKLWNHYKTMARKNASLNFVVATPAVYLGLLKNPNIENIALGAENVFYQDQGSYTGAVSIPMVQDCGATTTLIGHSERRNMFGVSDEIVGKKIKQCIEHKMPMVVCFGETQRDEDGRYLDELEQQIESIISPFVQGRSLGLLTMAYEPVWAIGAEATRAVTSEELFSTLLLIKKIIAKHIGEARTKKVPILYGGSVNRGNAQELAAVPGVDGFLIGRASLDSAHISEITQAAL